MQLHRLLLALTAASVLAPALAAEDDFLPSATLAPFASEAELQAYFAPFAAERARREAEARRQAEERRLREEEVKKKWEAENPGKTWSPPRPVAAPTMAAPPAPAPAAAAKAGAAAESITNNQVAGVDEGGIVKVHGKHLVILRRGKLFTVNVDRANLAPVDSADAFGPDVDPRGAWYDEMLVSGNTVAVIGYSYSRGGTELALFDIDAAGKLAYRATYHVKSSDYYSSRNYASRLVGTKLVMYTPIPINIWHNDLNSRFPSMRRWEKSEKGSPPSFRRIADATRIYRTDEPLDPSRGTTLHTIVSCDLAQPELSCESSGVLGPSGRVFHVSSRAVYVWTVGYGPQEAGKPAQALSAVFRLPLDGKAPSALKTQGSPVDQFSFLEGEDAHLNVLVRANGQGDGMWRAERAGGNLALLRVPLRSFGDGRTAAPQGAYTNLPAANGANLQNRFIGKRLLYGAGAGWGQDGGKGEIAVTRFADAGAPTQVLALGHMPDRIDALGNDAIAIGASGPDLVFSSLRLAADASVASRFALAGAAQGESRSHGFFYKPDAPGAGILGLPILGGGEERGRPVWAQPASMLYLRSNKLALTEIGRLDSKPGVGANDGCKASCVDWYGNARPVFLRGRAFALLGYEIVEGRVLRHKGAEHMVETRRVSFAPGSKDFAAP